MTVTLLVMTDGRRDYIEQTIVSAALNLHGADIARRVIHDDSGSSAYRTWLDERFGHWDIVSTGQRIGFAGAVRSAWSHLRSGVLRTSHVFHLEDDFTFNRPVNLGAMARVLDSNAYLAQMALRRQPWNEAEREAGGVVEASPDDFRDMRDGRHEWLEHRNFWTTNPSLFRDAVLDVGWPDYAEGSSSEGVFGANLRERGFDGIEPGWVRFAYWGSRDSGEAVCHIGRTRVGTGYW